MLKPAPYPSMQFHNVVHTSLNRRLSNLLSSIRLFLDHSEFAFKRKYGKKSEEVEAFKKYASEKYDSSFSYRFVYKLRNYVQHCGIPIGSANSIEDDSGFRATYWFNPQELL